MSLTLSNVNSVADLIRINNEIKQAEQKASLANKLTVEKLEKAQVGKQAAHLEKSYLNEQTYNKARQNASNKNVKLPSRSFNLKTINKTVSFQAWRTERAIKQASGKLVTKFPVLTLPTRMLQAIGNKLPFLANNPLVKTFLPALKPLTRFIPYVGAALTIVSLFQLGNDLLVKPKIAKRLQPITESPPFTGGQSYGVYNVYIAESRDGGTTFIANDNPTSFVTGKIDGIFYEGSSSDSPYPYGYLRHTGINGISQNILLGGANPTINFRWKIVSVALMNGEPDTGGNIGSTAPAPGTIQTSTSQSPINSPLTNYLPGGSKHQPRTAAPTPARSPAESNKQEPLRIAIPAGKSITLTTPDGNSITVAPSTTPRVINIPRPLPRQIGNIDPSAITPLPITITSPNAAPIVLTTPSIGKSTISIPGQQPYTFNPANTTTSPLPLSTIKPIGGNEPVTLPPIPFAPTPTTTPTTPSPTAPATNQDLEDLLLPLGIVGGLAGLGFLIKQIHDRTSPAEIGKAAEAATCRTTLPGGCTSNAMNNAANQGSQNTLNALGAGAQAAELGLLKIIDNKLGAQMPGGLSAGFGRLSNFLGIDRVLNLLNTMAILHNAMMLSNGLKITLLETLSSIGNATGLLQTAENENVDLNVTFNKGIQMLIDSVIGEERRVELELLFKKYNRIYQAGANIINSVQSMMSSLGNVVEVTAEYTGKIGNSLKAVGAVAENAYQWMAEQQNARISKFLAYTTTVVGATIVLDALNEVAESVIEGQQAKTEADAATQKFKEELRLADKNLGIENKAVADEIKRQKDAANANTEGDDDTGLFSSLTL